MHSRLVLAAIKSRVGLSLTRWLGLTRKLLLGHGPTYIFMLGLVCMQPLHATEVDTFNAYVNKEKNSLIQSIEALRQESAPQDAKEFTTKKQYLDALLKVTRVKKTNLQGFLDNQIKQELIFLQKLKQLQQLPVVNADRTIQERVAKLNNQLLVTKQTMDTLKENLVLAQQLQTALQNKLKKFDTWYINYQLEKNLESIDQTRKKLREKLTQHYQEDDKITGHGEQQSQGAFIQNAVKGLINDQQIALIQNQLYNVYLQERTVAAHVVLLKNADAKALQAIIDTYGYALEQYQGLLDSLQGMLTLLTSKTDFPANEAVQKPLNLLKKGIFAEQKSVRGAMQALSVKLTEYQTEYKKIFSTRQSLAEYKLDTLPIIINKIMAIPTLFYKTAKAFVIKIYDTYLWLDTVHTYLLWTMLVMLGTFFIIVNRFLKSLISDKQRSRLAGYLYDGILKLIQRNIPLLCLFSMVVVTTYYINIPFQNFEIFFNLLMIWLIFRVLILIARLILLEGTSDASGQDATLYYRIKWMLLFGGWSAALMSFSHLLPLSLVLQDIFNRLFMFFILTVSLVAWRSRELILGLLVPFYNQKRRYIQNAIYLLVILIPVTLFTTAIIGLSGFFTLAWTLSRYQMYIVLVLVAYILARGLLFNAMELISEWMITHLHNGWLWVEVFLKPVDKILKLTLFLLSICGLFELFGWFTDALVMLNLEKIAHYAYVNVTGIYITVESTIEFLISLAIVFWTGKWSREFCYRWLYVNTKDHGIRNSFSVFTQYAIVLLGFYIALRVLGFDFSGMAMVLGGLAVGMGFGLKDFASNIVGGITLLVERPVREGDVISLGEYEGKVAHIGIRSMRISTSDNIEVMIPNAETFNKSFSNYTHQSGIIRTVIPIKVSRIDDPIKIQQLIMDVLHTMPEIVPQPPIEVYLVKIDEAFLEFEIRYFVNVFLHMRHAVRSKILFAITAQFEAAGVKPPVESLAVELKGAEPSNGKNA